MLRNYLLAMSFMIFLVNINIGQSDCNWYASTTIPSQQSIYDIYLTLQAAGIPSIGENIQKAKLHKNVSIHNNINLIVPDYPTQVTCYNENHEIKRYETSILVKYPGSDGYEYLAPDSNYEITLPKGKILLQFRFKYQNDANEIYYGLSDTELLVKHNNPDDNYYGEEYAYESPDEIWTLNIDGFEPPCANAYPEDNPYSQISNGVAKAYIKYGKNNTQLTRPIIMVEGIDFGEKIMTDPDKGGEVVRYGQVGWENIIQGLDESIPNENNPNPDGDKELFRNYPALIQQLREAGNQEEGVPDYDIVFIDFKDGADYMQKNGQLLIKLIDTINQVKVCGYDNVIVALSMGGQVAKYALTTMEKENIDHQTRMFISYDSPHLGANIPLSIQAFIWSNAFVTDSDWENDASVLQAKESWRKINKPASRQMLYETFLGAYEDEKIDIDLEKFHFDLYPDDSDWETLNPDDFIDQNIDYNCLRDQWYEEIGSLGYPQQTYNIAISNGSGNGINQNDDICLFDAELQSTLFPDVMLKIMLYALPGIISNNQNLIFLFNKPFKKDKVILHCDVTLTTSGINIPHYDNAPGCKRGDLGKDIVSVFEDPDFLPWIAGDMQTFCKNYFTTFMPTSSTVGYVTDDLNENLVGSGLLYDYNLTPFDEIYFPIDGENEPHVDANPDNINFFHEQRDKSLFDNLTALPDPQGRGDIYNFGRFRKKIPNLEVNDNGVLLVNKTGNTAFLDEDDSKNNIFTAIIKGVGCNSGEAIVNVNKGGRFVIGDSEINNIDKSGVVIIPEESELHIKKGGILSLYDGSRIEIKTGGKMYLNSESTLLMYGDANIVVEEGGELIIEAGARLMLDNAITEEDKGSKIDVFGTLTLDKGELDISNGNGYIVFEPGHELYLINTDNMHWKGHGKEELSFLIKDEINVLINTFIEDAYIQFEADINIELPFHDKIPQTIKVNNSYFTTISYLNKRYSQKFVCDNAWNLDINQTEFKGVKLVSQDINVISIKDSESKSMALDANMKITNTSYLLLENTDIFNLFRFAYTEPTGLNFKKKGLDLNHIGYSRLNSCNIKNLSSNYNYPQQMAFLNDNPDPTPKDSSACISIENSSILDMKNTYLDESGFGIHSYGAINVFMDNSAISRCGNGIKMTGSTDAGLVRMTCSKLVYNGVGIAGTDIILDIDPFIISQTIDGNIRPNTFLCGKYNYHFNICYQKKHPNPKVYARRNTWNNPNNFSLVQSDSEVNCFVDYGLELIQYPMSGFNLSCLLIDKKEDCFEPQIPDFPLQPNIYIDPFEFDYFCFDESTCTGLNIHKTFWKAMNCLYQSDIDTFIIKKAINTLEPLSYEYQTIDAQYYSDYCQHLLAVANAIVGGKVSYESDTIVTIDIKQVCDDAYNGTTDVVFLLDASGSIDSYEFADMKNSVISTVHELGTLSHLRYTITQFSGSSQFEITIPFTTDTSLVSSFSRAFNYGTHVRAAFENVMDMLDNDSLEHTNVKLVLYTDARASQFYAPDYDPYNDIKLPPYIADVTVVRYPDGDNELANKKAATIASFGGNYTGETEDNPGDPFGSEAPRKFHSSQFSLDIPGLEEEILNCDSLVLIMPDICDGGMIEWSSSNGGKILSDSVNVTSITTNGLGSYSVMVKCFGECVLYTEFDIDMGDDNQQSSMVQSRIKYENGVKISPIDREIDNRLSIDDFDKEKIQIYPNPANDKLTIILPEDGNYRLIGRNALGEKVIESKFIGNYNELNTSSINNGMIILEVFNTDDYNYYKTIKVLIMH